MMRPVHVDVRLKNNLLRQRRVEMGHATNASLCAQLGICQSTYGRLENMLANPRNKRGGWTKTVRRLADYYRCLPEDLFPGDMPVLPTNRADSAIEWADVARLVSGSKRLALPASELYDEGELSAAVGRRLATLSPREEDIVRARFGIGGDEPATLAAVAERHGISIERVRCLEIRALRKLRHAGNKNGAVGDPLGDFL
jgi:DNA-binding CsgD family transcriptional regulator